MDNVAFLQAQAFAIGSVEARNTVILMSGGHDQFCGLLASDLLKGSCLTFVGLVYPLRGPCQPLVIYQLLLTRNYH